MDSLPTRPRSRARGGSARARTPLPILLVALVLVALARPGEGDAEPVRVFAVGHKQRLSDVESVASFRARMFALVDRAARGPGLVQDGVDDVASHVRPRDPAAPRLAVVHFPEDTGLTAGLIGSRGAAARAATSSTAAFASLLVPYADPIAYYDEKFPGLEAHPLRGLVVALTDILYRSVYETFRDIATTYGVWVSVSLNVAPAHRVDRADDPDLVERLRDPDEPERDYAYVADSDRPHNVVWLLDPQGKLVEPTRDGGHALLPGPDGALRPSAKKAYLTPIEQTLDKPGGGLSLASAPVRDLDVLDTPVGAIAVVISKDAWMPDVNERFDAKGGTFTLQSEAFSGWAFQAEEWDPDTFKESGFGNLQSRAGFLFNAAPSLTGNLFEVTFDGQSAILEKRREKRLPARRTPDNAWIGQPADNGFVAIAPWIVPDPPPPGSPDDGLPLAARRRSLAASGAKLLPGSGVPCAGPLAVGACENGYREWILAADLDLPAGPGRSGESDGPDAVAAPIDHGGSPTSFGRSLPVAPGGRGRQRHPRVAAAGTTVAVVWNDTADGPVPRVRLAISRDSGRSFAAPLPVSGSAPGRHAELFPDVAVRGDRILVVWQSFEEGWDDDDGSIRIAGFDRRGRRVLDERRIDGGEALPGAGRWMPALAMLDGGDPVVAWIDERDAGPDGVALEHVYAARGVQGGARFEPAVRVDAGDPTPLSQSLDNKWAPAIAARGDLVQVAWTDFREYNWDLYTARSTDGGRRFGPNTRLNGYPDFERLCDSPAVLAGADGSLRVAWTDLRAREPDTDLYFADSRTGGASFGLDRPLVTAPSGGPATERPPSNQTHVALAAIGTRSFAVWQDDRAGNNDILFSPLDGRAANPAIAAERVDDTGAGPSNQYRPHLAIAGDGSAARCIVVWEDDREGRLRIYTAARTCTPPRSPLPELSAWTRRPSAPLPSSAASRPPDAPEPPSTTTRPLPPSP